MAYIRIQDIWQNDFNSKNKQYQIKHFLLEDGHSCVYELEDGRELRISVRTQMYHFTKRLLRKSYKHVVRIYDCFKMVLKDEYDEEQNVVCVISESIDRNFAPKEIIQSGINLFRNTWVDYMKNQRRFVLCPDVEIEEAYVDNNVDSEKMVIRTIKGVSSNVIIKDIALALHNAYKQIKTLDSNTSIYLYTDNIGMTKEGIIKLCNITHAFIGLNNYYEIETTPSSVTITYNPVKLLIKDNRLPMPLNVDVGGGKIIPVLGLIDTGAVDSGFTESFYKRAHLENLGDIRTAGVTGTMSSIITQCKVEFPNGHKEILYGSTMKPIGDFDILIGMDLLSKCKLQIEPYCNGFKYKITFK